MDFLRFTPAMNAMYPFCTNSRERAVFRFRRRKHGNETIQSNQMARFWKLFILLILIPGLYIIFKFTAGFLEAKVENEVFNSLGLSRMLPPRTVWCLTAIASSWVAFLELFFRSYLSLIPKLQ